MAALSVLVVDEDPRTSHLVSGLLADHGCADRYEILAARDGIDARPLLEGRAPAALVVVELLLPGINGWEVIRRLRGRFCETIPEVPAECKILAVSARSDKETVEFVCRLGADLFIPKPISPIAMLRALGILLPIEAVPAIRRSIASPA